MSRAQVAQLLYQSIALAQYDQTVFLILYYSLDAKKRHFDIVVIPF